MILIKILWVNLTVWKLNFFLTPRQKQIQIIWCHFYDIALEK